MKASNRSGGPNPSLAIAALWSLSACGTDSGDSSLATSSESGIASSSTQESGPSNGSETQANHGESDASEGTETAADGSETGAPSSCAGEPRAGSIDGVEPESHAHHPPMIDGQGNLYRVTESIQRDGNQLRMMKSSDAGATWVEMDEGNRPDAVDIEGAYQVQADGSIYVSVSTGDRVYWTRFQTSDSATAGDIWSEQAIVDDGLGSGMIQYSTIAVGAGRFVVAYSDAPSNDLQQIGYRIADEAESWSDKFEVAADEGSWTGPRVVLGANGVVHLVYKDHENHQLWWRKITLSNGELSAAIRVDTHGTSEVPVPHSNPVVFVRGGAETLGVAFAGADQRLVFVAIDDDIVGTEDAVSEAPITQDPDVVLNEGAVATLAVRESTVYAAWADASTGDIRYRVRDVEEGWADEQIFWDSGDRSALYVYCNVVSFDGCDRLACTFDVGPHGDDTGEIEYRELFLEGGT